MTPGVTTVSPVTRPEATPSRDAWLMDCDGERQQALSHGGFSIQRCLMKRELMDRGAIIQVQERYRKARPALLWATLKDYPPLNKGSKRDCMALMHFVEIIVEHDEHHGAVAVEGKHPTEAFEHPAMLALLRGRFSTTTHRWCNYGMKHYESGKPLTRRTQVVSNLKCPDTSVCKCGVKPAAHHHDHRSGDAASPSKQNREHRLAERDLTRSFLDKLVGVTQEAMKAGTQVTETRPELRDQAVQSEDVEDNDSDDNKNRSRCCDSITDGES